MRWIAGLVLLPAIGRPQLAAGHAVHDPGK
jgi:hypothetical protein